MYKVVLADDELVDLEYLERRLPWEEMELEIAGRAASGFAALKLIEEQPVDILISDIKMPIMSGLELAGKAKAIRPELKVIFISGHEDFAYAQQAVKLNAYGYVLKPIDDGDLVQLLNAVKDAIRKERQHERDRHLLSRTLPLVESELAAQWLEGKLDELPEGAAGGLPPDGTVCAVAIAEVDDVELKLNELSAEERERELQAVFGQLGSFIHARLATRPVPVSSNRICFVLREPGRPETASAIRQALEHVKSHTPLTITVGLGGETAELNALPASYRQAEQALAYKMFVGKNRLITPDRIAVKVERNAADLDIKLQAMFDCILRYDLVGIDDVLQDVIAFVRSLETKVTVYHFTIHVIAKLDALFREQDENIFEILDWEFRALDVVFRFETIDDLHSWLRRRLFELSERLLIRRGRVSRKVIDEVKNYVDSHLDRKVTLRDAADVFAFSPNYLGHLFKEETGETFSDYLIRRRMEKACEYLLDPRKKIYEITALIGYKNILYFNRQFKDHYGITPSEYRKQRKV